MNAKSGARERLELVRESLIELSHRIHAHPELGFEEERASSWLCESLTEAGFSVEIVGDVEPPLGDEFLDIAIAQREAQIEPDRVLDDRHRRILLQDQPNSFVRRVFVPR